VLARVSHLLSRADSSSGLILGYRSRLTLIVRMTSTGSALARSLTRENVIEAHSRIKPFIHLTPILTSTTLSTLASTPQLAETLKGTPYEGREPAKPKIRFFFKCENYQKIGAFKARGAFHALSRLTDEQLARGVCTHSSGKSYFISVVLGR
jgi:threonine dehydratase